MHSFFSQENKVANKASALTAAGLSIGVPTVAMADPVADITAMVTSIGTITAGAVTVIIAALTVRLGVKTLNRLMTKA